MRTATTKRTDDGRLWSSVVALLLAVLLVTALLPVAPSVAADDTGEDAPPAAADTGSGEDIDVDDLTDEDWYVDMPAVEPTIRPTAASIETSNGVVNITTPRGVPAAHGGPPGEAGSSAGGPPAAPPGRPVTSEIRASDTNGIEQLLTLHNESAPETYEFEVTGGASLELLDSDGEVPELDGSVKVLDAEDVPVAYIEAPWAIDADGADVDTHYEVDGSTLIQHVDHEGATYPVIADPRLEGTTLVLSPRAQRALIVGGSTALGAAAALLCGPAAKFCAIGTSAVGATIGTYVAEGISDTCEMLLSPRLTVTLDLYFDVSYRC